MEQMIRIVMLVLIIVTCWSQIRNRVEALEIEIQIPDKGPTSDDSDRQQQSPNSRDNDNLGSSDKSGDVPTFVNLNDFDSDLNSVVVKQLLKSLHTNIVTNDIDDDELGEEPKDVEDGTETEDEVLGRSYYEQSKELRNRTNVNSANVYSLLSKASDLGNRDAKAEIAEMHLLDVYGLQDIEKAGSLFEQLAKQGHSRGLFGIGFMHATGIGRSFDQARAITYYWMAAIKGNLLAKMSLAYRYYYGINVKQNCEQALLFYMETAENVASKITFSNGLLIHKIRLLDEYENESTVSKADPNLLSYYELIAEKGDTNAQIMLGQMYYQGTRGVPVDYEKAKFYFEMTTSSKSGVGMAYLGKIHLMQTGDKKPDYLVANYYFTMGAEEKNAIALTGLGYMHLYGLGMPVNYAKALKYLFAAVKDKYPEAHLYIGIMYFEGFGIEKNYEHASFHFQTAALSGNVLSYYYLGKIYAYGLSSMRSCSKAVELLKTVSERHTRGLYLNSAYEDFYAKRINESYTQYALFSELGYEIGQSNLAFIHEYAEIPLFANYNKSDVDKLMLMYWNRASEQGYGLAKVKSGDCYFYGQGTSVDYEMAAYSYQTAADLHRNSQAMFNLGYMHEQGIGLVKDTHLAKRYYDQAMEFNPDAKLPATLAIWKLQVVDFIENFNMVNLADQIVRNNGDMLFSIVLIIILLYFQNWHH